MNIHDLTYFIVRLGDPVSSSDSHVNWVTIIVLIVGLLWGAYVLRYYMRRK